MEELTGHCEWTCPCPRTLPQRPKASLAFTTDQVGDRGLGSVLAGLVGLWMWRFTSRLHSDEGPQSCSTLFHGTLVSKIHVLKESKKSSKPSSSAQVTDKAGTRTILKPRAACPRSPGRWRSWTPTSQGYGLPCSAQYVTLAPNWTLPWTSMTKTQSRGHTSLVFSRRGVAWLFIEGSAWKANSGAR